MAGVQKVGKVCYQLSLTVNTCSLPLFLTSKECSKHIHRSSHRSWLTLNLQSPPWGPKPPGNSDFKTKMSCEPDAGGWAGANPGELPGQHLVISQFCGKSRRFDSYMGCTMVWNPMCRRPSFSKTDVGMCTFHRYMGDINLQSNTSY